MKRFRPSLVVFSLGLLCLLLAGCSSGAFDYSKVQYMLEVNQLPLDGEQIMMTQSHIDCGVQAELWDITQLGPGRAIARLTQQAKNLHFDDDVQIGEPGMRNPYAQVRGTFQLRLMDLGSIRDEGDKTKLVDAKIGVVVDHPCFQSPLPQLMAVRHGRFTQEAMPTFRFHMESDWIYDHVQH